MSVGARNTQDLNLKWTKKKVYGTGLSVRLSSAITFEPVDGR
jgi:hypothetical protein